MNEQARKAFVKIIAVVFYFIIVHYFMYAAIFCMFDGYMPLDFFVKGVLTQILFWYTFTWLYRLVVKEYLKLWVKPVLICILVGVCSMILANVLTYPFYLGSIPQMKENYFIYNLFSILSIIVTMLILFFVIDKRRFRKCSKLVWIPLLSVVVFMGFIIAYFIVTYTPFNAETMIDLPLSQFLLNSRLIFYFDYIDISETLKPIASFMTMFLFFLLAYCTKERKIAKAE